MRALTRALAGAVTGVAASLFLTDYLEGGLLFYASSMHSPVRRTDSRPAGKQSREDAVQPRRFNMREKEGFER